MKIAAILVAVLIAAVGGFLFWMGAFELVRVSEQERGPYSFVYVQDPGTGEIAELSEALAVRLDKAGFSNRKAARLLYPAGRGIRNQVGFIVDRSVQKEVLGADTFFRIIPLQNYAAARFPYRNALSYFLARQLLAAPLEAYRKSKGIPELSTLVMVEGGHLYWLLPLKPS